MQFLSTTCVFGILCSVDDDDEENEDSQVEDAGEHAGDNNDDDQEDTNGGGGDARTEGQPKPKRKYRILFLREVAFDL